MFKKIVSSIMIIGVLAAFSLQSFAASVNDIIYDKSAISTEEFLVSITRPEGNESTFKKSYVIRGNTALKGIRVEILRVNENDELVPFENSDGESSWEIGDSGMFMKEVMLPNLNANQIRIVAYQKENVDNATLGENLQLNDFTITVIKEEVKDKIKNGDLCLTDLLNKVFNYNRK